MITILSEIILRTIWIVLIVASNSYNEVFKKYITQLISNTSCEKLRRQIYKANDALRNVLYSLSKNKLL